VWLGALLLPVEPGWAGLPPQSDATGHDIAQKTETAPVATPPARAAETNTAGESDAPGSELEAFLGTWIYTEVLENEKWPEPVTVERYLLLKWRKGRLRVKTVDYFPEKRTRGMESNWNGTIDVDRWNAQWQTFTPEPDGTISMALSGTWGLGPDAGSTYWWAAGRLAIEESDDGPILRYITNVGYAPAPTGNAWVPLDRSYRLVSREIDPRFDNRRRR
jgi:hypothetical protein